MKRTLVIGALLLAAGHAAAQGGAADPTTMTVLRLRTGGTFMAPTIRFDRPSFGVGVTSFLEPGDDPTTAWHGVAWARVPGAEDVQVTVSGSRLDGSAAGALHAAISEMRVGVARHGLRAWVGYAATAFRAPGDSTDANVRSLGVGGPVGPAVVEVSVRNARYTEPGVVVRDTVFVVLGRYRYTSRRRDTEIFNRAYTDAELLLELPLGPLDLGLTLGSRVDAPGTAGVWGRAAVTLPLSERFALLGAVGRQPRLPELRRDGGWFTVAGIQVNLPTGHRPTVDAAPALPPFQVLDRDDDDRHTIVVRGIHAGTLELSGDFTDWQPAAMTRLEDGVWSLTIRLNPGTHRVTMRVDGGAWTPPPGVPTLTDEFSGRVGVVVVP